MRHILQVVVIGGIASALTVLPLSAAVASPSAPSFGQHVSQCARTVGFSAAHNPGMHHGASGWTGMPCV